MVYDSTIETLRELIRSGNLENASSFFERVVFPDLVDTFKENNGYLRRVFSDRVGVLVLSVGKSWIPIALSILYFRPIFIIPITTKESSNYFSKALSMVRKYSDFTFEVREIVVESTNVEGINLALKNVLEELYELFKRTSIDRDDYVSSDRIEEKVVTVVFDITGGKKTMSLSLGFLGVNMRELMRFADIRIIYIDSIEDEDFKKIRVNLPGSERIVLVSAPSTLILKEIYVMVKELFESYAFGEIAKLVNRYIDDVIDEKEQRALKVIISAAKAYGQWMKKGDYSYALKILRQIRRDLFDKLSIENDTLYVLGEVVDNNIRHLKKCLMFLRSNRYDTDGAFIVAVDLLMRGMRLEKIGEKLKSLILFYQSMELSLKHLLSKRYGLNPLKPNYRKLEKKIGLNLREKFSEFYGKVFGYHMDPPERVIAIHDLIILLKALENDVVENFDTRAIYRIATELVKIFTYSSSTTITSETLKWIRNIAFNVIKQVSIETGEYKILKETLSGLRYPFEEVKFGLI